MLVKYDGRYYLCCIGCRRVDYRKTLDVLIGGSRLDVRKIHQGEPDALAEALPEHNALTKLFSMTEGRRRSVQGCDLDEA